jgi:tellurite resistance protein
LSGGIYVGERLEAVSAWAGVEPALIDPRLPVDLRRPDFSGQQMGYWPSYADIPPSSRAAYLHWLAAGRPAGAYIGYVFLFFYGIERRIIKDLSGTDMPAPEVAGLMSEVERLLALYSDNGSFRGYATEFLATARLAATQVSVSELPAPSTSGGWEVPMEVKLVAGATAVAGRPLAADWALAWALNHPEVPLRTPARRCGKEFAELFAVRYRERFGEGILIKPNKTPLHLQYRPASASFGAPIEISAGDLPDVTRLAGPTRKLAELVAGISEELDAYSRYVGRHEERESARAVALLPAELAVDRISADLRGRLEGVPEDGEQVVASGELVGLLGPANSPRLSKRDAVAVSALLAAHGVGLEPDIRVGAANFSHHKRAVLWRDSQAAADVGESYAAGTALLHLGVMVGASDGEVSVAEQARLESGLEEALDLPAAGRRRLRAHLRWLVVEQPGVAGLKARVGVLDEQQRQLIARYLVAVAGADGRIAPQEVDTLRRLYGLLGLDPARIHGDLHALSAPSTSSGPVPVLAADAGAADFAIRSEILLDRRRLAEVMSSTQQVADVLTGVFVDEEPEAPEDSAGDLGDSDVVLAGVGGLDGAHAALVHRLSAQPSWSRVEFDALVADVDLLPAGAMETINDAAFAMFDAPLLEGDDPIELDGDVLKELLHV